MPVISSCICATASRASRLLIKWNRDFVCRSSIFLSRDFSSIVAATALCQRFKAFAFFCSSWLWSVQPLVVVGY